MNCISPQKIARTKTTSFAFDFACLGGKKKGIIVIENEQT